MTENNSPQETCNPCGQDMETLAGTHTPAQIPESEDWGLEPLDRSPQVTLHTVRRNQVASLGMQASLMAATLDPRLAHNATGEEVRPKGLTEELLGATRDMADYLGGDRVPPETNRNGIPHAKDWQLDHAVHLIRDVAYAIEKHPGDMPPEAQAKALMDLLYLATEVALVNRDGENKRLLDLMVAGKK